MRHLKDRRDPDSLASFPLEDNDRERVYGERRKQGERRLDNMEEEERQPVPTAVPTKTTIDSGSAQPTPDTYFL